MTIATTYFSAHNIGATLIDAFRGVMRMPTDYFAAMPESNDYRDSSMLLLIYLSIPALMVSLATGIISIVIILPVFLIVGFVSTWMWASYLGWAARYFCGASLSTRDAFQICAYGTAPLVFSWIPILGLVAWLWNLYLNWQGLISHGRLGGGSALLIIIGAFVMMGLSLLVLVALLAYYSVHFNWQWPPMPTALPDPLTYL